MNWRANLLALAVYCLLGLLAGAAVFFTMRQWSYDVRQAETSLLDSSDAGGDEPVAMHLDRPGTASARPGGDGRTETGDLALLRALLDERTEQLNAIRRRLDAAEKRRDELQRRYDRVLEMMDDWVAMVETMNETSSSEPEAGADSGTGETAPDRSLDTEQVERRISDLQEELAAMAIDLAERESQLADLTEELIEQQAKLERITTRLLRPAIEKVLPELQAMLADSRTDVRKWACELVIALGPAARDAESALRTLLEAETDDEVKQLASRALDAIAD